MPIKTSSAKQKGRKFQQLIRDKILALFPDKLEAGDVLSTSMGAGGEDLKLSPAARKLFPYSIECKKHAKIAIYSWYDQASTNAGKHEPLLFIQADRRKTLVVLDADHFLELVKNSK